MSLWPVTGIYAAAHFAVDFGCAYALFSAGNAGAVGMLLYNFCAFALQMPMGLLADRFGKNRLFASAGILVVLIMALTSRFSLAGSVVLGVGNGLFHVGGGLEVMNRSDRAAPLGVFVSPGALGLYLGTILGKAGAGPLLPACVLGAALAAILILCRDCVPNMPLALPETKTVIPAVLLFAVVLLRSCGGMAVQLPWKTGTLGFAAVLAVVLGKTAGGFLGDCRGIRKASAVSLGLAAVCFLFADTPFLGMAALFLFNMTMPLTLWSLAQKMPGCKGFSFGLLTFALFLGFVPVYLGMDAIGGTAMAVLSLASLALLWKGAA